MKYNILIKKQGETKECFEQRSLMDSLGSSGNLVPKGCHNGACGVCKMIVYKGEYKKEKMNRRYISEDEESKNIVLACKVFPLSNMEIDFIQKKKTKHYCFGDNI